ncbi:MAG: DUF1059 domain-containing protein [Patescibacteria group bacterium]
MKKLTCAELGGLCDTEIKGNTPEEIMMGVGEHLKASDDPAHKELFERVSKITMEDQEGIDWDKGVREKFAAAPDMTQEEMELEREVPLM